MKFLLKILLISYCYTAIAGLFDNETKVRQFVCDQATGKQIKNEFLEVTYVIEKNTVFSKTEIVSQGKVVGRTLDKLEACNVIDKSNWKCGGENSRYPNGSFIQYSIHQVVNGKYSHLPRLIDHKPESDVFCKYEQIN